MHRVGKYDRDRALDALAENDAIELVPVERKQKLATAVAWLRCVVGPGGESIRRSPRESSCSGEDCGMWI